LPQGVDMARVRVVVGDANVRRRQRRQAGSCELRVASTAKKVPRPKHGRACTNAIDNGLFYWHMDAQPAEVGLLILA
jgi:hypothetical protein